MKTITLDRAVVDRALDALTFVHDRFMPMRDELVFSRRVALDKALGASMELRAALANAENEAQAARIKELGAEVESTWKLSEHADAENNNLRAQLSALQSGELPEPSKYIIGGSEKIASGATTEYAVLVNDPIHDKECTPIYTADQVHQAIAMSRAKMVPLTDEQIKTEWHITTGFIQFARAIEATHGIGSK